MFLGKGGGSYTLCCHKSQRRLKKDKRYMIPVKYFPMLTHCPKVLEGMQVELGKEERNLGLRGNKF